MMLPVLLLARALLPECRDPDAGRLDLASVVLFLLALLPLIYAVKTVAAHGPDAGTALALAAGAAFATAFVRRQHRLEHPLLDLRLFRNRAFTGPCSPCCWA
ncbi:hypothetical protein ABZ714_22095 [Streptomyces sp. NPDC006798]|uniref:hypothetical protein n=1 Tax=Streptomyces sp. NPDC006798 TaxID=3155462 RepID=UPI0034005500